MTGEYALTISYGDAAAAERAGEVLPDLRAYATSHAFGGKAKRRR